MVSLTEDAACNGNNNNVKSNISSWFNLKTFNLLFYSFNTRSEYFFVNKAQLQAKYKKVFQVIERTLSFQSPSILQSK